MINITVFDIFLFIDDGKKIMKGRKFVLGLFVLVTVQRHSTRFVLVRLDNRIENEDNIPTNVDGDYSQSRSLVHGSRRTKSMKQKGSENQHSDAQF